MVDYITGINGIGKSRIMFETAVATAEISKGNVVFVDGKNKLNRMLPPNIRLINADDCGVHGAKAMYGFLAGLCAGNYDITDVFVDSTAEIIGDSTNLDDFFELVAKLSERTGVDFHFSVCDKYSDELVYQTAEL